MEKEKNKSDFNLIKKLFNIEPVDWARYADGRLSFISPTGQKFVYSDADLEKIDQAIKDKAAAAKPPAKPAAASKAETPAKPPASKAAKK